MMFTPDINEFRGIRSVQLIVRDIRVCRRTVMERKVMIEEYSKFAENPGISISEDLLPVRSDFKNVYLYIRRELDFTNGKPINLYKMMKHTTGESVTAYIKLRFILAIFLQTGIVSYSDIPDYTAAGGSLPIVLNDMNSKVDLKTSEIYRLFCRGFLRQDRKLDEFSSNDSNVLFLTVISQLYLKNRGIRFECKRYRICTGRDGT